ncbi:uncharacterized protein F4822DRAFT_442791 [Hypoxylon trugodes]|uniref:uncharacterized protein n=1 Tax=Hypoxylon trugodes TaxID=326681 RepID=UPI00219850AC|nr:uncharacterized protein F4822DRAFT_442791 [Hypoxylon trugodes]KAI1389566.1 hypothetical protein F4822DRAFT_442791 [Hypoxylon trugodes]
MDPVTAINLVCNVLDLICRAGKIVKETYDSTTGLPKEQERLLNFNEEIASILNDIQNSCMRLEEVGEASDSMDINIQTVVNRCRALSSKITSLLGRGKSEKPHSIKSVLKATGRHFLDRKKVRSLQTELEKSEKSLHLAISASVKTQVNHVIKSIAFTKTETFGLRQELEELSSNITSSSDNVSDQYQKILDLFKRAKEKQRLDDILMMLGTYCNGRQLNPRYDELSGACENTYEWIFREPEKLFAVEPSLEISFTNWLRRGDGIFHILGKPGAGKSTLMKFIWKHELRSELLSEWAGNSRLLSMRYFFWSQSNQDGIPELECTLLMSALEQAPELIDLLVPKIGNHGGGLRADAGYDEISQATALLMSNSRELGEYKIFLLIDGLDEFEEGKGAKDYHDLVRLIRTWASQSEGKVKICVSSREYAALTNITKQKIRLQKLTRRDMQTFVTERLETHHRFPELKAHIKDIEGECQFAYCHPHECQIYCLVDRIVDLADGVFFWVQLVMIEVRKRLQATYSPSQIWIHVEAQPKPLVEFIKRMLNTIPPLYQRESYTLLAIIHKYSQIIFVTNPPQPISHLLALSLLYFWDKVDQDSVRPHCQLTNASNAEVRKNRRVLTEEEINARFNGLLETSTNKETPTFQYLIFAHRSIIEVLNEEIDTKLLEHGVTQAELSEWVCQLAMNEITLFSESKGKYDKYALYGKLYGLLHFIRYEQPFGGPSVIQQFDQVEDKSLMLQFGTLYPSEENAALDANKDKVCAKVWA